MKTKGQRILSEREEKLKRGIHSPNYGLKDKHVGLSSTPDSKLGRGHSRDLPGKEVAGEVGSTAYEAFRKAGGNNYIRPEPNTRKQYDRAVDAAGDAVRKLQARRRARAEHPELDAALRKLESKHASTIKRSKN